MEGSGCGLIFKALHRHLPGRTEENHKIFSQDIRYLYRDLNPGPHNTKQECQPNSLAMFGHCWLNCNKIKELYMNTHTTTCAK
jgi:hypothetical protein